MSQQRVVTVLFGLLASASSAALAQEEQTPAPVDPVAAQGPVDQNSVEQNSLDQNPVDQNSVDQTSPAQVQLNSDSLEQQTAPDPADPIEAPQGPMDEQVPVADEQLLDERNDEPLESSDEVLLRESFLRYRELLADGITDEADAVAKRVIELSIRINGADSVATARALTNLAIVQQMNEQYGAAQLNFQSAIEIIQDREDRLNTLLINPLTGLGKAQLASERPDLAAKTFQRAVHITHVNEGPHNMDQVELLESLAETNLRLGDPKAAKRVHDTVYELNRRYYRSDPIAMVPSLMRRANWQHRTGYINDSRATYRRVIRTIETSSDKNDLRLIQPLISLGRSFFFPDRSGDVGFHVPSVAAGEVHFKRALRIAKESTESNWRMIADTTMSLGNYYLWIRDQQKARIRYQEVWDMLAEGDDQLKYRERVLGKPVLLRFNSLPRFAGSASREDLLDPDNPLQQGVMRYEYTVSPRGRVYKLKVSSQDPEEFAELRRYLTREMRGRIYRPQFSDDGPVLSQKLTGTHRFNYKQSDLDALRLDQDDTSDADETTSEPENPSS